MRRIKAADGFRQASVSQSLIAISTQSQWIPHVITSPFCVALQYNLVSGWRLHNTALPIQWLIIALVESDRVTVGKWLLLITYRITWGTQEMFGVFEVNGDTTEASASDSEIPAWAVRRALQSLAPSPHIPTHSLKHTDTHTCRDRQTDKDIQKQTHIGKIHRHIYMQRQTDKHTNTYKRILMGNRREMALWGIVMCTMQTCGETIR